jgi:hypothetical protein
LSLTKKKYLDFIQEKYVPVFFRGMYLDIVCEGLWDVVLYEEKERITAAYIYMIKRKIGLNYIIQPKLCPYTGPIFFNPSNPKKAYSYLIDHLPSNQLIIQDYFHSIPKFNDFANTHLTKHTYVVDKSVKLNSLWLQQSSKHRRIIQNASKTLKYELVENFEEFQDFLIEAFLSRGKKQPMDINIFKNLDKELHKGGLRRIVKCTDSNNIDVAMAYLIIDEKWTFNFANAVNYDYTHNGMHLILWKELERAINSGKSFDFEGSMLPGVDKFYSRFKGTKTPYQSRYKSAYKLIDFLVKIKT